MRKLYMKYEHYVQLALDTETVIKYHIFKGNVFHTKDGDIIG
ncbi:hypothetical protein [Sedimentibacter hydroxybenzoicus]|nr:hypothetical protein [Sedimentibacter hydroxybenzoicus]